MAPRIAPSDLARGASLVLLVGLTVVLGLIGLIVSRWAQGFWFVAAFIALPLWLAFAIAERSGRGTA